MTSLELRAAHADDLRLLERDVKPAYARTFEMELAEQDAGIHTLYLAIDGASAVGWCFVRWLGPRDADALRLFADAPELFRLEVREDLRSRGIGRALITAVEADVRAQGFAAISLGVAHENPRAYALYQQLGYQDTPLTDYFDEYQYQTADGELVTVRDRCRYLVKPLR